jgi:hypothetical protein
MDIKVNSIPLTTESCLPHTECVHVHVRLSLQQDAGMVGYRFNTIGVSDGISMGTDGMSFSLQSRDLIADSIETVMSAQVREVGSEQQGAALSRRCLCSSSSSSISSSSSSSSSQSLAAKHEIDM